MEKSVVLELNDVEAKLKRLLLDVAHFVNPEKPSELRFTGGWVRDKLLGVSSHDIDVAINDMTGYQFGLKIKEFLQDSQNLEKYGLKDSRTVHGLHKIEANPEKSKHLETVTTKIFGLDIDLVNLRKETYSELSRNPTMEFGTPEEDAMRRDATVNALFYNLQSGEIEDLTKHGLQDMRFNVIRTPLEPHQTFKDDPLRVLRLIRFASRLHYSIDPAAKDAMRDQSIKDALKIKISRERVGVELEKMLKGPDPYLALSLINEMGLYTTIFSDPIANHAFVPDTSSWMNYCDSLYKILESPGRILTTVLLPHDFDAHLVWLLAAFVPFADAPEPKNKSGKSVAPLPTIIAREGIKATNKTCDLINSSIQNFENIIKLKDNYIRRNQTNRADSNAAARDHLGMAIRRWGASWRYQALFALLIDETRATRGQYTASILDTLSEWDEFLDHLRKLDILNAFDFKPLLNGNEIATALNVKPGPWMKETLNVILAWQLRNPTASKENALEAVLTRDFQADRNARSASELALHQSQGELVADLVNHFLLLTVRPLFIKTMQTHEDKLTPQGNKLERSGTIIGPSQRSYVENDDDPILRPWKDSKNSYALELLEWVLKSLTQRLTEQNWSLLIPPIMTLLDDLDTKYKAMGCDFLRYLLEATSSIQLKRTSVAEVFDEALKPSLSYLPTLTPEPESIRILKAAYSTLFTLVLAQAASLSNHSGRKSKQDKALRAVLHSHVLPSLSHISPISSAMILPYPLLTATLIQQIGKIVKLLGYETISQLQYIIPTVSELVDSPFVTASNENILVLKAAIETLQLTIASSWIRIWRWRVEIFAICCKSWIAITKEQGEANVNKTAKNSEVEKQKLLEEAKALLRVCVSMLIRAVETTSDSSEAEFRGLGEETNSGEPIDIRREVNELSMVNTGLAHLFADI